jgi:hypothetical protein
MTTQSQKRSWLQEAGWSRHQRGFAWRKPAGDPDRSFYGLDDAFALAVDAGRTIGDNPVSEPPASPRDGPARMPDQ